MQSDVQTKCRDDCFLCADLCDNNFPRLSQPVAAVDALLLRGRIPRLEHMGLFYRRSAVALFPTFTLF